MLPYLITAFSLGLFGSLHCAGMCAPLMLAAGGNWGGVAAYQLGRLLTYGLLGALLGSLGWGAALLDFQRVLAIACGALLLLVAVTGGDPANFLGRLPAVGRLQLTVRRLLAARSGSSGLAYLGLGCCNGLLPCGLVYLAVVGAANAGDPVTGAGAMMAFGLGTLPLLLTILLVGRRPGGKPAAWFSRLAPAVTVLAGVLLIWRGVHASLPPGFQFFQDMAFPPMCH